MGRKATPLTTQEAIEQGMAAFRPDRAAQPTAKKWWGRPRVARLPIEARRRALGWFVYGWFQARHTQERDNGR